MRQSLAFLTRGRYWDAHSRIVALAAKRLYGVDFPGRPRLEGSLTLKLYSTITPSVIVGRDAEFYGDVDLRTRDDARMVIGDRVKLDGPVRIVAAGNGIVQIGSDSRITCFTIINGGGSITIGRGVIMGPRCSINANEHRFRGDTPVTQSGFDHIDIRIGDDVWIGSDVAVLPGADIADGTIIGANSVVNGPTEPGGVYVGSPVRKVGTR